MSAIGQSANRDGHSLGCCLRLIQEEDCKQRGQMVPCGRVIPDMGRLNTVPLAAIYKGRIRPCGCTRWTLSAGSPGGDAGGDEPPVGGEDLWPTPTHGSLDAGILSSDDLPGTDSAQVCQAGTLYRSRRPADFHRQTTSRKQSCLSRGLRLLLGMLVERYSILV